MNLIRKYLQIALLLAILIVTWGCGGGGGSPSPEASVKSPTVSIVPSDNGEFVIQGDNLDGVAAIELTISYDSATMTSPSVQRGVLISGALMVANSNVPGTIKIAIASTAAFAGSGQIATISFASVTGTGNVSVSSVRMINDKGAIVVTGSAPDTAPTPTGSTGAVPSQVGTVSGQGNGIAGSP